MRTAIKRAGLIGLMAIVVALNSCALRASRLGIPPEVEGVVASIGEDANEGRYDKIHSEADEEWRSAATLEKTMTVFNTVKDKLGKVKSRQLHTAEETTASGRHSFVLAYETKFERGEGMETFTLVERNGRWLLAGYFVNSTALQ
jgi:hypothetical protein